MSVTIPQTSIRDSLGSPFPGVLADTGNRHSASKYNAEDSAEIPFGIAVVRDATDKDNGVVLPHTDAATSAPLFAGVVQHSHAFSKDGELGDTGIKPAVSFNVLERGRIHVLPEEAVAPGDAVRFRVVVAGQEQAGAFRTSADGTDCVDISAFARWVTSGNTSTPAVLEIDMVGASQATADT